MNLLTKLLLNKLNNKLKEYNFYIDNAQYLFYEGSRLACKDLFISKLKNITKTNNMFYGCTELTSVSLFDTSNVTLMTSMFSKCSNLSSVPLFNTSKATNMDYFFDGCTNIEEIPLFVTDNVTSMSAMLQNCTTITEIPLFNTNKVTYMNILCKGCTNLITVPLLDTTSTTSLSGAFESCPNLSNESLNNILLMCSNSNITMSYFKTLKSVGLSSTQATTCQGLSNYQAFLDAGWTTGY